MQNKKEYSSVGLAYKNKAKTWKRIGLIGGGVLALGGAAWTLTVTSNGVKNRTMGISVAGAGLIIGTTCYIVGNKYDKKADDNLVAAPMFENKINLSNGNSLALGVDAISDNISNSRTLGLGLRLNF